MEEKEIKYVLLDCPEQDIFGKPFEAEHAERLFELQRATNRNDWVLSKTKETKADVTNSGTDTQKAKKP